MKIGHTYSTEQFTYHKDDRMLTTFASDLSVGRLMGHLYDDACDYGFWLRSHKTGKIVACLYKETSVDPENDIRCWELETWDQHGGDASGIKVLIWND